MGAGAVLLRLDGANPSATSRDVPQSSRVCKRSANDAIAVLYCTANTNATDVTAFQQVVAVLMKTAQGNPSRVDIVKELAPQCSDLSTSKYSITSLLSDFEKMLVGEL